MKKVNIALSVLSAIALLVIAIQYHTGHILNIDKTLVIAGLCVGIVFLIANAIQNWKKAFILFAVSFLVAFGIGKFAIMTGYVGTYVYTQATNLIQINKITNSENSNYVFSYDGKQYYIDKDYTYLYEIDRKGFSSTINVSSIMIASEAEASLSEYFGEFYATEGSPAFYIGENIHVTIAFAKNIRDNSVFVKLVNSQKQVFYSYITLDNVSKMAKDLNIIQSEVEIGGTTIYLTKASKIINGTTDTNETEYTDGKAYVITSNDKVFLSDTVTISFSGNIGYYDRVNYFLYAEYMAEIDAYKAELAKLPADSDDYKALKEQIQLLEASIVGYYTELCHEVVTPEYTIRLYRSYKKEGTLAEVPDMNVIEIQYADKYVYAMTDISLDDLK